MDHITHDRFVMRRYVGNYKMRYVVDEIFHKVKWNVKCFRSSTTGSFYNIIVLVEEGRCSTQCRASRFQKFNNITVRRGSLPALIQCVVDRFSFSFVSNILREYFLNLRAEHGAKYSCNITYVWDLYAYANGAESMFECAYLYWFTDRQFVKNVWYPSGNKCCFITEFSWIINKFILFM